LGRAPPNKSENTLSQEDTGMTALLRTIIIDSDEDSRANLQSILAGTPSVIVGEFGNIPEALRTAPAYRPDVVIAEIPLEQGRNGDSASSAIEHLARVLPDTAILVTGATQSAHLVIQVMRAGALDFVARPVKQDDLREALQKVARSRPAVAVQQRIGRVLSVYSAKGGTGVTTVATNLAVCWAKRSPGRTVLVDLDTRQSDVATFLNLRSQYSVLDAFENIGRMDESFLRRLLTEHSSGLLVLPGAAPMDRVKLRAEQVQAGLEILRSYFDQVILDLPHDMDIATVAALEASETILFLVSQNVSALRLGTAGIAALRRLGIDLKKVRLVVMRERSGEDPTFKQVREMFGIPIYWKIPSDYSSVLTAINNGDPLATAMARSKLAKNLSQLSETLADQQPAKPSEQRPALLSRAFWNLGRFSQGTK
jgi:pilus assembly protein CpaE